MTNKSTIERFVYDRETFTDNQYAEMLSWVEKERGKSPDLDELFNEFDREYERLSEERKQRIELIYGSSIDGRESIGEKPYGMSRQVFEFIKGEGKDLTRKGITNGELEIEGLEVALYYKDYRYYFTIGNPENQDIIKRLGNIGDSGAKDAGSANTLWQWINYQVGRIERNTGKPTVDSDKTEVAKTGLEEEKSREILEKAGYDYEESLKVTSYIIGSNSGKYDGDFISKFRKFQKDRGLKEDGILGEESIRKIKENLNFRAIMSSERNNNEFLKFSKNPVIKEFKESIYNGRDIPQEILTKVKNEYKRLAPFALSKDLINGADYFLLSNLIYKLKDNNPEKYKDFYDEIDNIAEDVKKDPVVVERVQDEIKEGREIADSPEVKRETQNLVDLAKSGASSGEITTALLKSKTGGLLVLGAGLFFLFGAFGNKSTFTDSWWKRGLLIFGLFLGSGTIKADTGKSLTEWIGVGIDAAVSQTESTGGATEELRRGFENPYEMPSGFGDAWKSTTSFVGESWEKLKEGLGKGYKQTVDKIDSIALDTENELYVGPEKIKVLRSLDGDSKFLLMTIDELDSLKDSITIGSDKFSEDTKTKLKDGGVTDEDLQKYIKILLKQKNSSTELVRDLYVGNEFINGIKLNLYKEMIAISVGYVGKEKYPELEKTVSKNIAEIIALNPGLGYELAYELSNIGSIEEDNLTQGFEKIKNFLSRPDINSQERTKLEELLKLYESAKIIDEHIREIDEIKLETTEGVPLVLTLVDISITNLENIKSSFDSESQGKTVKKEDFERVYNAKRLELVREGAKLEGDSGGKYTDELSAQEAIVEEEEKKAEYARKEAEVGNLITSLGELPGEGASLETLSKYLNDQYENLLKVKKLLLEYKDSSSLSIEAQLRDRLNNTVGSYSKELAEKFKREVEKFEDKITKLKTEITKLEIGENLSDNEYNELKSKLDSYESDYSNLNNELKATGWESTLRNLIGGTNIENIFTNIEAKLKGINSDFVLNSSSLEGSLAGVNGILGAKKIELNQALSVEIELNLESNMILDSEGITSINTFVTRVIELKSTIGNGDEMKDKREALKNEIGKLIDLYVEAIEKEIDPTKLDQLKSSYETNVSDRLDNGWEDLWNTITGQDEVISAYNKRKTELEEAKVEAEKKAKIEEFKKKKLKEIFLETGGRGLFIDIFSPYIDFIKEYPNSSLNDNFNKNSEEVTIQILLNEIRNVAYSYDTLSLTSIVSKDDFMKKLLGEEKDGKGGILAEIEKNIEVHFSK